MRRGATSRLGRLLWPAAASLLLAGCVNQPVPSGNDSDPLTGGPPIPATPTPEATAKTTTPPGDGKSSTTQPPATPHPSESQASLAANTPKEKVPPADPRTDPRARSTSPDWHPPPGASLHEPQPVDPGTATPSGLTRAVAPAPAGPARADSWQQAQDLLTSLGVTEQRLETVGDKGDWHFYCVLRDPMQPTRRTVYEKTAP